jgi:O-antigen/teichoic acid export membrane protein
MGNGIINRKRIKDMFVYGFGQAVNLLSPLAVLPYLIAVCGEAGLGRIGVGFSMALILNGIVDYGSYIKGVKDISINRDDIAFLQERFKAIYLSKLILFAIIVAVMSLVIFTVPFFARDKDLFFLSFAIVLGQFINPAWFFQATENFVWISIINIVSKAIYVVAVFLLIAKPDDYIYANLFFGAGAVIANSIGFFYIVRRYSVSFANLSFTPAIQILRDEFSFSVSQFFLSVYQFFPIMIVSYFGGDFMAGQYRVIDQIVNLFKSYLNIFFYFVYANICYEINSNFKRGLQVWKQYNGLNFLFLLVVIAVFFVKAELIFTYFKIDATQMGPVVRYFRIALGVPLLIAVSMPLRQLMFAFEKNRVYIIITIAATIVNLALLAFLTMNYQLKGSFISIIIIESIVIVLYLLVLKTIFRADRQWKP